MEPLPAVIGQWASSSQGHNWKTNNHSRSHIHTYGQFADLNVPHLHVFQLWEEARLPGGNPNKRGRTCIFHRERPCMPGDWTCNLLAVTAEQLCCFFFVNKYMSKCDLLKVPQQLSSNDYCSEHAGPHWFTYLQLRRFVTFFSIW